MAEHRWTNNLDVDHTLKVARDLNLSDLRFHLTIGHGVSVEGQTPAQMGKTHLLAHTILAHPSLKTLLHLEKWNYG